MNELHRQMYLSALGVDTYMPRLHLPFAPESLQCELPMAVMKPLSAIQSETLIESNLQAQSIVKSLMSPNVSTSVASPVNNLIGSMFEAPKVAKPVAQPITAADILAQLDTKPITIEPFSLSIWRPLDGVMIVDSRNTKLALPTELLLNNILRSFFPSQISKSQEEILRWPMIENSFTKRTAADACNELQTWLSVQHEIRPIRYLLLMGANSGNYLLPEGVEYKNNIFKTIPLIDAAINALILPSLNEVLQKPVTKKQLYSALRSYLPSLQ